MGYGGLFPFNFMHQVVPKCRPASLMQVPLATMMQYRSCVLDEHQPSMNHGPPDPDVMSTNFPFVLALILRITATHKTEQVPSVQQRVMNFWCNDKVLFYPVTLGRMYEILPQRHSLWIQVQFEARVKLSLCYLNAGAIPCPISILRRPPPQFSQYSWQRSQEHKYLKALEFHQYPWNQTHMSNMEVAAYNKNR